MSKPFDRFVVVEDFDDVCIRGACVSYNEAPEALVQTENPGDVKDVIESHSRAMFEHTRDAIKEHLRDLMRENPLAFGSKAEEQIENILRNLDFDAIVRNTLKP